MLRSSVRNIATRIRHDENCPTNHSSRSRGQTALLLNAGVGHKGTRKNMEVVRSPKLLQSTAAHRGPHQFDIGSFVQRRLVASASLVLDSQSSQTGRYLGWRSVSNGPRCQSRSLLV